MRKTLLFSLLGIGAIPARLRPLLEAEGIVVSDEGMGGWFVTRDVKGPGRRYRHRREGFSGCLVVTARRIVCYTYWKRQINVAVDDPGVGEIRVDVPEPQHLSIAFESSVFRDDWSGVIEFLFRTDKAEAFADALVAVGAQRGAASRA